MAESDFTPPEGFEITGSIRSGNRRYGAGDEEAFAASGVKEADFERLVEAGVISVENAEEASSEEDSSNEEVEATEAARELAAEHDIELSEVEGAGADGKVIKSDVEALVEEQEE